jgi:quinone-modifying oxidoreductase subunit QmoC
MKIDRTIRFEEELDKSFTNEVVTEPGGERIWDCLQCGTCSATCPVSTYMDKTPRQIIGMIRAGFKEDVLSSISPWICVSCYSCTVECPAGIRITDIMYIIKRMAMQDKKYQRTVIPAIEDAFVKMVYKNGRLSESRMGIKVAWKSGIFNMMKMVKLAWKLFWKGRIKLLRPEKMENPKALRIVLDAITGKPVKIPEVHPLPPQTAPRRA